MINCATFLNIVILYYLLMRRDVWFANHLVEFLRQFDSKCVLYYIIFQKSVNDFEITHNTCSVLVLGPVPP